MTMKRARPGDSPTTTTTSQEWNLIEQAGEFLYDMYETATNGFDNTFKSPMDRATGNCMWAVNQTDYPVFPGQVVYWEQAVAGDTDPLYDQFVSNWVPMVRDPDLAEDPSPVTTSASAYGRVSEWSMTFPILKAISYDRLIKSNWQTSYLSWGVAYSGADEGECFYLQVSGVARAYGVSDNDNYSWLTNDINQRYAPPWNPEAFPNYNCDQSYENLDANLKPGTYLTPQLHGARLVWEDGYRGETAMRRMMIDLSDRSHPYFWEGKVYTDPPGGVHKEGFWGPVQVKSGIGKTAASNAPVIQCYYPKHIGGGDISDGKHVTVQYYPDRDLHILTGAECEN